MDIVGTVSAAISFVNFIVKAVYTGKEVADSGQAVKEHEDLDALAVTVGQGSANLQQKLEQNGGHALSPEEASLLTVLRQCTELHTSIRKLREKGEVQKPLSAQGRSLANRGRDKLQYGLKVGVVAIRVILNRKEDGESLRAQFTACSVALNSVLLLFMRKENLEKWERGFRRLQEGLSRASDTHRQHYNAISEVIGKFEDISQTVSEWVRNSKTHEDHIQRFEDKFDEQSEIQKSWQCHLKDLGPFFTTMSDTVRDLSYQRVLHDISFPDMNTRRKAIREAHLADGSFEWLVDDTRAPDKFRRFHGRAFQTWLREGRGVFYISGKPGSGKSVLMNFLSNHMSTRGILRQWEPCRPDLALASAFFWSLRSTLQKSKEGLLRTLLHDCLAARPDNLIPWLFPERMTKHARSFSSHFGTAGTLPFRTVQESLERLVTSPPPKIKLCLFIDGVDEFQDPSSESFELAKLLTRWSSNSWVKICLAGREEEPWLGYFSQGPRLRLHQVTARDIRLMIEKSISNHDHFLSFNHFEQEHFIYRFVEKAEGVFIWVRYVKRDIVEALDYKQTLNQLHQILCDSPTELGPFYKRMFDRIKEKEAWIILKLMRTAIDDWEDPKFLSAFHFSFVGDIVRAGYGKGTDTPDEIGGDERKEELKRRLYGFQSQVPRLFRGVVEATTDKYLANLTFTHRTARDFLVEYTAGRLGDISLAQSRIINSGINEPRLVLQLITLQTLTDLRPYAPRINRNILRTVVSWIKGLEHPREYLGGLINLESALMRRQGDNRGAEAEGFVRFIDRESPRTERPIRFHQDKRSVVGGTLYPDPRYLMSVFAICVTSGFVHFLDWLHANPTASSTTFGTGHRQAGLIEALYREVLFYSDGFLHRRLSREITSEFFEMLERIVRTPEAVPEGSRPGNRIVDPLSTLKNTSGLIGPRDLTVSEYVLLRIADCFDFFKGAILPWNILAILLEHGATMDVLFNVPLRHEVVEIEEAYNITGGLLVEDYREVNGTPRYVIIEAADRGHDEQGAFGWGFKIYGSASKIVDIIEDKFPNGASLFDLFDLVGPKSDPKILRAFENARIASQHRSLDTPGLPTDPVDNPLSVESQILDSQESETKKGQEGKMDPSKEKETVTRPSTWRVYLLYSLSILIAIVLSLITNSLKASV